VEDEIDPILGAPSLGATEKITVKSPCGGKIIDRKGQMERLKTHAASMRSLTRSCPDFPRE